MRYMLAILLIAFLVIVGTVVLIGRGNSSSSKTAARITKLVDYDTNDTAGVSWTQQGRLVGDNERKAIRITITRSNRRVEVLDQYAERAEKTQDFTNTAEAFSAFVRALDAVSFGRERAVRQADERGVCPLGNRFIYRLTDKSHEVMRTWSDTCTAADGPFGGGNTAAPLIAQLFKAQITDYNKFIIGVQL